MVTKVLAPPRPASDSPWRQNKKGGWSRKLGTAYVNVYEKNGAWRWAGPLPDGSTHWAAGRFMQPEDAMADADAFILTGLG